MNTKEAFSTLVAWALVVQLTLAAAQSRRPVKFGRKSQSSPEANVGNRFITSWSTSQSGPNFNDDSGGVWTGRNNEEVWDWGSSGDTNWRGNRRDSSSWGGSRDDFGVGDYDFGSEKTGKTRFPSDSGRQSGDIIFGGGAGNYENNVWGGNGGQSGNSFRPNNVASRPPWNGGYHGGGSNSQVWGINNNGMSAFGSGNNNNFAGNPWFSGQDNRPNGNSPNNRPNSPNGPNGGSNNSGFGFSSPGRPAVSAASSIRDPTTINGVRPPSTPRPNCGCNSTNEYNPVCGTDGATYENSSKLRCARFCGKGYPTMKHRGACTLTKKSNIKVGDEEEDFNVAL